MIEESWGDVHFSAGPSVNSYGVMQTNITPADAVDCVGIAKGNCSSVQILSMFKQYLYGNGGKGSEFAAPGIGYCLQANHNDVAKGLRCYNSGSVPYPDDVNSITNKGRWNYVSNIGQRLVGVIMPPTWWCEGWDTNSD